jgi:hypothetical protein
MRLLRIGITSCIVVTGLGLGSAGLVLSSQNLLGQDLTGESWKLEMRGDGAAAREQLRRAAENAPNDPLALESYAVFLDRHRDPEARNVYQKLSDLLAGNRASAGERARIARRLVTLDLLAGDREAVARHLEVYRAAGGAGLSLPAEAQASAKKYVEIPGPLRSFARMAAISPEAEPDDILAALSHNIVLNGYSASHGADSLEPTEYLKLLQRYLAQAREIEKLAGEGKALHIEMCESAETGDLLRVLGYRMRGGCGSDLVLETVNASRAFLTIDSGFPLSDLEEALRTNRSFNLDYRPSRVPILFGGDYWIQDMTKKETGDFIDSFLGDPTLCRLYSALSALDPDTAEQIRKDMPAQKAKAYAHVLDFFGGMFEIREGKVMPPGGARSEKAWADLVGVSPERGAAFIERLFAKDDGWLASYYDSLARINGPVQEYLTEPDHLKRFYTALRGRVTSPGPARPVFRSSTDLVLLTARLRLNPDGRPHLPGGLEVWKNMYAGKAISKYDPKLAKAAPGWKEPEEVIEAFFGLAKKMADNEPLKIFLALTDVERNRPKPLETATVEVMIRDYRLLGSQYALFSDVPTVTDGAIIAFLDAARANSQMRDFALRGDAAGTLQALTAFWQIFVRQGSIAPADADAALAAVVRPFAKIQNSRDVFDAGQKGVRTLLDAAQASSAVGSTQDHMLDLLAGTKPTAGPDLSDAQQQMLQDMTRAFEAQRLISLETLFTLADHLESAASGQKPDSTEMAKLASRITEVQLPRNSLTTRERTEMSAGFYSERHIDAERKANLRSLIDRAGSDPQKLRDVRAALTPYLRDTLVGLAYIHYAPPGAQVLFTNPLFVRNHDFFGTPDRPRVWTHTEVFGNGWPANAGGRLVGSLSALPYALAEVEQNFLIPSREQALIWGDLVPQMIQAAVIPRFWNVTPVQLHWIGLHMAYAETALADSTFDAAERQRSLAVLGHYVPPARLRKVENLLIAGDVHTALDLVVPSEMYLLASELAPADRDSTIAAEIRTVAAQAPEEVSARVISHAFGSPKPMLTNSYQPELLNLRTFPTLMGYSSRILAESWESNLLFYAALADEVHIRPAELNLLVPGWTQQTVERIFATHLEDWPALLRSLRQVGDDVVQKARKQMVAVN